MIKSIYTFGTEINFGTKNKEIIYYGKWQNNIHFSGAEL